MTHNERELTRKLKAANETIEFLQGQLTYHTRVSRRVLAAKRELKAALKELQDVEGEE